MFFSIYMPVHNESHWVRESVENIAQMTPPGIMGDWVILMTNGGGIDTDTMKGFGCEVTRGITNTRALGPGRISGGRIGRRGGKSGDIIVPLYVDGREIARAIRKYDFEGISGM